MARDSALQKYPNKCDWRIMKTKRKNFYCEEKAFYYLNQQIIPGRSEDTIFGVLAVILKKLLNISK